MVAIISKQCRASNRISLALLLVMIAQLCLFSNQVIANSNSYQLEKIAQLSHEQVRQSTWQQVLVNPKNKQQYFVINQAGQLFLIDGDISQQATLDLKSEGVLDKSQDEDFNLKLTAIALHPNFALRDQVGYNTFYTAHLEPIDKNSKTKRLQERSADLALQFDAVVTEWQFNSVNPKKVDLSTKREVVRIAVPDESLTIGQMSFNPAVKSWNDNFGLLFISLTGAKKWQKPLYSGVILRINPAKFGLRSFTVPNSNPFLKDSQIKDAIYLLGAQQIQQFIWPDKNSAQLLVVHQQNKKQVMALTEGRDDWRIKPAKNIFHQNSEGVSDVVMYRGRNLPYLRNKLLLLNRQGEHWVVESLAFKGVMSSAKNISNKPQLEWQFTAQQFPTSSQPSFTTNLSGEVLLLDNHENFLYRLTQENTEAIGDTSVQLPSSDDSQSNTFLVFFILSIVAGAFYYLFKRNKFSAKALVRQQYAHLELSVSKQQIGLYRRHQKTAELIIDLVDIIDSEIQLNNHRVSLINAELGHGFSDEKEQDLRAIFSKEHVDKMVDGKVRQISLLLTDSQKNCHVVCLYMRKGSNRITKKSYFKVVDDLVNWCWLIGRQVNPSQTEKRKVKSVVRAAENNTIKAQNAAPLHNQAAAIRPVTHQADAQNDSLNASKVKDVVRAADKVNAKTETVASKSTQTVKNTQANQAKKTNSTIDTELVNALEKLVNLKQQGFLSTEEFAQAKAKLLKNLFDKQQ